MELPKVDPPPPKTIDKISRDEETKKKIVDIIDHQFDLEIYLKRREVATIRNEITKAESILQDLKLAVENETLAANMPEAAHYTRRSALYYHGGSQALLTQPTTAPKRKIYRTSEKSKLYGRRQDGTFVSLACPACHRDDFANQQGFLNHCRISHNLEFGPYEQVMQQCGTPVDESEVPMDNPARLRPVMNLIPVTRQQKKLERPSIKVFEEDVDMELENERRISLEAAKKDEAKDLESNLEEASASENKDLEKKVESEDAQATDSPSLDAKPMEKPKAPSVEPASSSKPIEQEVEQKTEESVEAGNTSAEDASNKAEEPGKIESVAAAMLPASAADVGSRFYIKRRILVGNVSKYIAPERRDPSLKQFTHKWMVYVVEPPNSKQEVSAFITCVRFFLHPSYKPHDVVDVTEPPFKLTRFGWGEFPIRMQLFFVDKRRNKTVDIIHHLKLDHSQTGKQLLGGERSIEIELDRNTDFKDTSSAPSGSTPLANTPTASTPTASTPIASTPTNNNSPAPQEVEPPASLAVRQKMSLLNGILKECVKRLPVVRAGSHGKALPYSCATSSKMFFHWSVGKRKALERQRARMLRLETQKRAFEVNDNVLRIAAEALTTKDVILWCRENKHTPIKSDKIEDAKESDLPTGYCKFCGSLRDGHDESIDDSCPRRPKGWNSRKKNGGINSITNVSRLLSQLEVGWDEVHDSEDDMVIDIDMDDGSVPKKEEINHRQDMLERVEQYALSQDTVDVANERSIDWIWSVVGQLRLKSVIANDMLLAKDGNLQGPTSGFDLASAMKQRLVVGNVLTQATRAFLKRLIDKTSDICHKEEEGSADKSTKMMVPYHVYQAAQQSEEFDFLTNQYMDGLPDDEKIQSNKE